MIKYSIRGENIEVTEALRDYVESKLSKVEKYFHEDTRTTCTSKS
ncbi:Ribosome-associated factor Y [Streptococcus thermophilus CNCM I-1630]|nr:Ribosome-associated factor Y [Streptococcus thermophilus CNCM I-1630]